MRTPLEQLIRFILFLFLSVVCLIACDEPYEWQLSFDKDEWSEIDAKVRSVLGRSEENVAFLFFTDPHLLGSNNKFSDSEKSRLVDSFAEMKVLYDKLPVSFCLSGGDWLNNGDTQDMAKEKLLLADEEMKEMFPSYFKIMGNHDTNYQGIVSDDDISRGDLSREWVDNEYYSETGSAFFSFISHDTAFYVLDSGLDWNVSMNDYRWEQIKWLAGKLQDQNYKHIVLAIHMFYLSGNIIPMSEELVKLCDSFNHKTFYSADGIDFDFSKSSGTIHFIISGHRHLDSIDFVGIYKDIPTILTCKFTINNKRAFDVCVIDYSTNSLEMFRIGEGEDRRVKMAQ